MKGKRKADNTAETGKHTWRIEGFSGLSTKKLYSQVFQLGDYKWRILIYPKGNDTDYLSMYVDVPDSANLPDGWCRYLHFSIAVVDQVHTNNSVRKNTQHLFNARESDWGFKTFMPLGELYDPSRGYLVNDTCIIELVDTRGKPAEDIRVRLELADTREELAALRAELAAAKKCNGELDKELGTRNEELAELKKQVETLKVRYEREKVEGTYFLDSARGRARMEEVGRNAVRVYRGSDAYREEMNQFVGYYIETVRLCRRQAREAGANEDIAMAIEPRVTDIPLRSEPGGEQEVHDGEDHAGTGEGDHTDRAEA